MNKRLIRILVPLIVAGLALGVVIAVVMGPGKQGATPDPSADGEQVASNENGADTDGDADDSGTPNDADDDSGDADADDVETPPATGDPISLEGLTAVEGDTAAGAKLGSLDPEVADFLVETTAKGAGIERITFSDIWETAKDKRTGEGERYVLQETQTFSWTDAAGVVQSIEVPLMAAHSVTIDGTRVDLVDAVWRETAPARFEIEIVNELDESVVRLVRHFTLGEGYDINLEQTVENLAPQRLQIQLVQYGPVDLRVDRSRYMDRRRVRFGYTMSLEMDPQQVADVDPGKGELMERSDVIDAANATLWPTEDAMEQGWLLSWFASTNRYFALVVHPPFTDGSIATRWLVEDIDVISKQISPKGDDVTIFTGMYSPVTNVDPGGVARFDVGIYAGPQDSRILEASPYDQLNLDGLILYQMSSCCAICTFQWLAHGLLNFMGLLHSIIPDYGIAIIILVLCVRLILHPITKKSQISMQRFSRSMSAMKPELDRLQKKYKDEPKKLQAEQMRLMREHGTNPLQALGCLPLFLQTPIWIALYAGLYFAYELRHEPAFFGVFQQIGGWQFLADLSAADHCLWEFETPFNFLMWNITGINILPILMGLVFFFQQKYMTPPPSPTMTDEQIKQQKIMRFMTVVMFPLMLYSAPSGLTLYIMTSSSLGILEGWYIRRHLSEDDVAPKKKVVQPMAAKPWERKKPKRDAQGKAYDQAVQRAKQKRKDSQKKSYKKKRK